MVPAGQGQDEAELHELRRLDPDEAEIEPVAGPAGDIAEGRELDHQDQQQQHPVERIGGAEPPFRMQHGQAQHHHQQQAEADRVLDRPRLPIATGDRIEHGGASEGDQAQQGHQTPVQLGDLGREPVAFSRTGQGRGGHCGGSDR